jgi:hypothetical protein
VSTDTTFASDNPVVVTVQDDYFGFGAQEVFVFPDGATKIWFTVMNEGQRKKFQKMTNRDIKINRATNDASIKADPAEERWQLITTSVCNWNLKRRNPNTEELGEVHFDQRTLEQWLQVANPRIVDDLEVAIRKANPWMQADMTVEDIDKEMERLTDLRKEAAEREQGK